MFYSVSLALILVFSVIVAVLKEGYKGHKNWMHTSP